MRRRNERARRANPERETRHLLAVLNAAATVAEHHGAAAIQQAVADDVRGYPINSESERRGTGSHSDPTAHAATRRAGGYDTLADDLLQAHDDLEALVNRYVKLVQMATATADPLNSCSRCERRVTGRRDNRLIGGMCRPCYDQVRRAS